MFKPTKAMRTMLSHLGGCAYVFRDGVAIVERRTARSGKYKTELNVLHTYPCDIHFQVTDYQGETDPQKVVCLVVHHPELLIEGLDFVRIIFNGSSQLSEDLNIYTTSVVFMTPNGCPIEDVSIWHGNVQLISGGVTVQNHPRSPDRFAQVYTSLEEFAEHERDWIVERHETK